MILRRNETGHLDRVFNLTYESVDIVADRIQHFLAYIITTYPKGS